MFHRYNIFSILVWLLLLAASLSPVQALEVEIVSPNAGPGLIFTDKEEIKIRAQYANAAGATRVIYTLEEVDDTLGMTRHLLQQGQVMLSAGKPDGSQALPLNLLKGRRGLYQLTLTAPDGTVYAATSLAVVFQPQPTAASPWGVFYVPPNLVRFPDKMNYYEKLAQEKHLDLEKDIIKIKTLAAHRFAKSLRRLGASWVRFNFWEQSFDSVTVKDDEVATDLTTAHLLIKPLRDRRLHIMGEIAQCPRPLSSTPDDLGRGPGGTGPGYGRVKPASYPLWCSFITNLAREFNPDIGAWEIWNEPNGGEKPGVDPDTADGFWKGTSVEFAEHLKQTSTALRNGNPAAQIAASGFTPCNNTFIATLFEQGVKDFLDIFSMHYLDSRPAWWLDSQDALLKKYDIAQPLWVTEESSPLPLRDFALPW